MEIENGELASFILGKKEFSTKVEDLIKNKPMPYMDAIIECAAQCGLEPESAAKLLSKNIKDKLEFELQDLNVLISTSSKLPI